MASTTSNEDENSIDHWPTKDIVSVAVMGSLFLLALVEWFLWLGAFNYCLWCVLVRSKSLATQKWSTRVLAVFMIVFFTLTRLAFLPITIATLPLPRRITSHYPVKVVDALLTIAFACFLVVLTIPWVFWIYQLWSQRKTEKPRTIKLNRGDIPDRGDKELATVYIVMPCHNEPPEKLERAVSRILESSYPFHKMHLFISFDGDETSKKKDQSQCYLRLLYWLRNGREGVDELMRHRSTTVVQRGLEITVSKFPWGGKRHVQKETFKLIQRWYKESNERNDEVFILFIDSDCLLDPNCIRNFMKAMKPGDALVEDRKIWAMTGVITPTDRLIDTRASQGDDRKAASNSKVGYVITLLQDLEYVHGQLFERSVESACGTVTCLPGALTMFRFSALEQVSEEYFEEKLKYVDSWFDYGKGEMGEDRYLTHLLMREANSPYQIGMCRNAYCKTKACETMKELLDQRRRWFLGFITNEACMLTDAKIWRKYPILCHFRLIQNTFRSTALMFLILIIALCTSQRSLGQLPYQYVLVSLGLNWALMIYLGARIGRYKAMLYPVMFVVNPFFNWMYIVYGICTAGRHTWGGPRETDQRADGETSPRSAAENARRLMHDDLAVVPKTFRRPDICEPLPLQPGNRTNKGTSETAQTDPEGGTYSSCESTDRLESSGNPFVTSPTTPSPRRRFSFKTGGSNEIECGLERSPMSGGLESSPLSVRYQPLGTGDIADEGSFYNSDDSTNPIIHPGRPIKGPNLQGSSNNNNNGFGSIRFVDSSDDEYDDAPFARPRPSAYRRLHSPLTSSPLRFGTTVDGGEEHEMDEVQKARGDDDRAESDGEKKGGDDAEAAPSPRPALIKFKKNVRFVSGLLNRDERQQGSSDTVNEEKTPQSASPRSPNKLKKKAKK